jgi:ActR/RegA family two-component response regulator
MPYPSEISAEHPVVLIVDDDDAFRLRLAQAFRDRHWGSYETGIPGEVLALT